MGIQVGFIYSLLALGIVLIFRTTRVLNFAHADISTFGAFITLFLIEKFSVNTPLGFFISVFLGAFASSVLSFLIYFFIMYEGQRRGVSTLGLTIITIAVAFVIQSVEIILWGAEPKSMPSFVSGSILGFSKHFILIASVSFVLMLIIYTVVMRTNFGISMRAISQNLDAARLLAINVKWVVGITWAIAGFVGGIAGILIAPLYFVDQFFLFDPFLKAFVGTVIGGLDSPLGAVLGGIIVGISESLFGGYVSIKFKSAFIFLIAILSLVLRPEGIFGREIRERV